MKRTKIGDVFLVEAEKGNRYFQYLGNDSSQLGGNMIAAFVGNFEGSPIEIAAVISQPVEFFAITTVTLGLKMQLWKHVGNALPVEHSHVLFRDTNDYGNPELASSDDWWVWSPNTKSKHVGPLVGEYRKSYIGVLAAPTNIAARLRTGKYSYSYPVPQGEAPYLE
ncbi:hypothetical protein ACEN9F_00240 [Duganella sp. CT11-25]|uniref:hypothetical protein n=1 Tax=unclassified Duganella TaxID=2636909 RepID=UPI0039AF6EC5